MTFTSVLNLSISASWLVLAVVLVRMVLKKAPNSFRCALWALVALRLLCPVSFESGLSLIPSREVIPEEYLYMEPIDQNAPARLEIVTNPIYEAPVTLDADTTVDRVQHWDLVATVLWLAGVGAMSIYAVYSYLSLRLRVRGAGWVDGNVWECDELDSPFILGLLRPRVYLPSALDEMTRKHVLAHENAHLKRLDHLWKPLGFLLLSIHWFNPVMWQAYVLLCRDIELACDERVIRQLDKPAVRAYSEALVSCSVSHRMIAVCPLAFGEVGVKGRIKSMLHYKKPGFRVLLAAAAACAALAVCFLTDPVEPPAGADHAGAHTASLEAIFSEDGFIITDNQPQTCHIMFYTHWIPDALFSEEGYTFAEDELTLIRTETSSLQMRWAGPEGEALRFDFSFSYDLPESGTIVLPYCATIKGIYSDLHLAPGDTHDYSRTYDEGVHLVQEKGVESFSLLVDRELYQNLDDYLSVALDGIYELSYVPAGMVPQGEYLRVDEHSHINPKVSLLGTSELPDAYVITEDLHLIACEPGTMFPIERDQGTLLPVTLDHTPVPDDLREQNLRAWRCAAFGREHLLLQQEDGGLYVAVLAEEGTVLGDLFRLKSSGEPVPPDKAVISRSYGLDVTGTFDLPTIRLSSDGTFTFKQSMVSSYYGYGSYTLSQEELILKTADELYIWHFTVTDGGFAYDAARSSPISYLRTARELAEVTDGELFRSSQPVAQEPPDPGPSVEDAISAAILRANGADRALGRICTERHKILAELAICGTATADGGAPTEELIVYLYGAYSDSSYDGRRLYIEDQKSFPATASFTMTETGYALMEYRELTDQEAEEEFPGFAWEELEQNRKILQSELLSQCREQERAELALLAEQLVIAEGLLDAISSSPAQSSNPGAYIDAHPGEYAQLLELGSAALHHCFGQLSSGEELGVRGCIMASACQQIIERFGETCVIESYYNGQSWFNQFVQHANRVCEPLRWEETRKTHPACALAIIYTAYQELPPP